MTDAVTQVYFCHEVLSRSDLMPLLARMAEGEIGLVNTLIGLSRHIDPGYERWCQVNHTDRFCGTFNHRVTPTVANRVADYMLEHRQVPDGPTVVQWVVEVLDEANTAPF